MAERRGRRPSGNYKQKTQVFSTRITAELRQKLEKSSKDNQRSISQEVEHRLRRLFDEDQNMIERFGNRRNYSVLRLISSCMDACYKPNDPNVTWLDDPYIFAQLERALAMMLDQLRPPGDPSPPPQSWLALVPNALGGTLLAAKWLNAVKDAPPDMIPVGDTTKEVLLAALLRSDLGEAADRISISPDAGATELAEWIASVAPRKDGESDDDYRSRLVPTIRAIRTEGKL